jgi:hypothetical protein
MKMKTLYAALLGAFFRPGFGEDTGANSGFTGCLSKAGLGIAGTADRVKITAPNGAGIDYAIGGIAYHKADADNIDTGVPVNTDISAVQAADTHCLYLFQLDSSGTLTTVKGQDVLSADVTKGQAVQWPQATAGKCAIGGVKVVTVGVTFTLATTNFDAAGVTETWYDFACGQPTRPQTS